MPQARSIREPGLRERRDLVEVLARAFVDNPMNVALHGRSPRRRLRANRAGLRALILDGSDVVRRVVCVDGRVVGGWVAVPPGRMPLPAPGWRRQLGCLVWQGVRAMDAWGRVDFELGRLHPVEPHWYLAVLGVDPARQGEGLGSALLGELHRLVARAPAPVYLETDHPGSARFYGRHGYIPRGSQEIFGVDCVGLGRGFAGTDRDPCDPVRVHA